MKQPIKNYYVEYSAFKSITPRYYIPRPSVYHLRSHTWNMSARMMFSGQAGDWQMSTPNNTLPLNIDQHVFYLLKRALCSMGRYGPTKHSCQQKTPRLLPLKRGLTNRHTDSHVLSLSKLPFLSNLDEQQLCTPN